MQLSGSLFSTHFIGMTAVVAAVAMLVAARHAPWRKLLDGSNSNVFFGALVSMLILWVLRTEMEEGLVFHLSAMTALTLMFGWSMAIIGGFLAARFGTRAVITAALILMGATMILTGLTTSFGFAFAMRFLTGLGNGAAFVPAMALGSAL